MDFHTCALYCNKFSFFLLILGENKFSASVLKVNFPQKVKLSMKSQLISTRAIFYRLINSTALHKICKRKNLYSTLTWLFECLTVKLETRKFKFLRRTEGMTQMYLKFHFGDQRSYNIVISKSHFLMSVLWSLYVFTSQSHKITKTNKPSQD